MLWVWYTWHEDQECQKVHKGFQSTDGDEFQFGLWMHAIAPKIKQRKGSPNWSKFSDDDEEDNQVIDGEEDGAGQPNIHHQPPTILMTSEANKEIAKQKLENPRQFTGLSMPKFPDPIQI